MRWSDKLKPGDKVFEGSVVRTVERRLKNHIVVDGHKYSLRNMRRAGDSHAWNAHYLTEWTQEREDEIKEQDQKWKLAIASSASSHELQYASVKTLRALAALVAKAKKESASNRGTAATREA